MLQGAIFKSVNIREDVGHPERLGHYHPTSRSAPVIASVLAPDATMVIAAYGSGKSLAAGLGLVAAANEPKDRDFLIAMAGKVGEVDRGLGMTIEERAKSKARGQAAVLSGYERDLPASLSASLGLGDCGTVRKAAKAIQAMDGVDHVAIVWDEFGRHLEGLVAEGRSRDLDGLQELAELAVRGTGPTVSLTLLLHQNVLAYANSLNQTSRSEWKKIEGRFRQVRFVEDSRQLYGLIASSISARRPGPGHDDGSLARSAAAAAEAGWFDGLGEARPVEDLVRAAAPVSAAALHVLPRLAARVAQNERSLFSFIENVDLSYPVGMEEVYHAFSDAIRSDVGVGGLHRRWIEAESALAKAEDEIERELIAAAFLLQAGVSGERKRLRRATLEAAAVTDGHMPSKVSKALDALIARKLVIHRKLNDEVSVWHGADVDIAGRLRDERIRMASDFGLAAFLSEQHPASYVRPVRHNAVWGTSRYLSGAYATAATLEKALAEPLGSEWGRVVYVLCGTADEVRKAKEVASEDRGRQVVVVPDEPLAAADAALEVAALSALRRDEKLLGEDPLAGKEVDELLSVARRQLARSMHRLTTQRPVAASWHSGGRQLDVSADRPANVAVSDLMDSWFSLTPRIANDQMVRTRLSRQMTTARIRLVTRLMDRSREPGLGYDDGDGSAEASVYRTVLARTGLHVTEDGAARYAWPREVRDPGLREAWRRVERFFTEPGRKPLSSIVEQLSAPPVGMAAGVIPVIVLAGYKAFAKAAWFRNDGAFVRDVLGFVSTLMFNEPERHEVEVHASRGPALKYLDDVAYVFSYARPGPFEEKVSFASMAIGKWLSTVAEGARRSKRMPNGAKDLLRACAAAEDVPALILDELPDLFGGGLEGAARYVEAVKGVEEARNAVDGLVSGYLREAVEVVGQALRLGSDKGPIEGVHEWIGCFDVDALLARSDLKLTDKTVLRTVRESLGGRYSAEGLARVLSSVLLQRGIDKWQDDTAALLRRELREARERIEAAALDVEVPPPDLEPILRSRIADLEKKLRLMGAPRGRRGK